MVADGPGAKARIAVLGTGRMGREVWALAGARDDAEVVALVSRRASDWAAATGRWQARLEAVDPAPDLLIDFSLADATPAAAGWCAAQGVALLSGVTGLDDEAMAALRRCGDTVPVLWAPNLSVGVNLLAELVSRVASAVDTAAPVTIDDRHHRWKQDAPSGTALMLGRAVASARGGNARDIEYRSRREGEVVGEHGVHFRLADEEIVLQHKAGDRRVFARGALEAGLWLRRQPPRVYTAAEWLAAR